MIALNRMSSSTPAAGLGQGLTRMAQAAGTVAAATASGTPSPQTISQAGRQALAGAGQVAQSVQTGADGLVQGVKQAAASTYAKVADLTSALKG